VNPRVLCVNLGSRSAKISLVEVAPDARAGEPAPPVLETECSLDELAGPTALEPFEVAGVDFVAYRVVRIRDLPAFDAVPFDSAMRSAIAASIELAPLHTRGVIAAFDALSGSRAIEAARAASYYDNAVAALPPGDRGSMAAAEIMRKVYHRLLVKMRRDRYRVFEKRYSLSKVEKIWIIAGVCLRNL